MNSIRTDRKPSSIWSIVAFAIVVGLANPMIFQMIVYWQNNLPARLFSLVDMFLLSIFVGQWMFVVLISGLTGRVWLKGLAMGSDRKAARVWTFGFFLFTAISISMHAAIDGWNK